MTRGILGAFVALLVAWSCAVTLRAVGTMGAPPGSASPPAAAPVRLMDTGLYVEGRPGIVDPRNRPFAPQYPLWSDGLTKARWVFLPEGAAIDASDEHEWELPVGTKFWKEFAHGDRRVETRLSWRASESEWVFGTYVWNDDGSDAVLADASGVHGVVAFASGRSHDIPSRTDCLACHSAERPAPLGFSALQLSPDRDPGALHAETSGPGTITLADLATEGRLRGARADLLANPPRIRTEDPATRSVLGYLASNCGSCHNGRGEIAALGPVIRTRDLVDDGDAVMRSLTGQPTRWQIPGTGEGTSVLVDPGSPDTSALFVRMRSRRPSSQMPPLGTVVRDDAAVNLVRQWIASRPRPPAS
jgi:hypothetical protein